MAVSFYTEIIAKDKRFHTTDPVNDLALLEPVTRAAVLAIIADAKKLYGVDLMPYETYRSKERQVMLYEKKVTKLKTVGVHHYGLACDLPRSINGEPSWKGNFGFLPKLCKAHGLISGITWGQPDKPHSFIDAVHVQRITLDRQKSLFNGSWYPDSSYDPYRDGAK